MKDIRKMKREFEDFEVRITRLKELEKKLDSLTLEGFEAEAESLRAQLKDPAKVKQIEEGIKSLGGKIQQRDLWKTKGASLFDTAVELCNKGAKLFYEKEYKKSLKLFREAVDKFTNAKEAAQHDSQLVNFINENIISAKRNIAACNLGLGALASESAQEKFNSRNYDLAVASYRAALSYFEAARESASEISDKDKLTSATKLTNLMDRSIRKCYVALDKDKIETLSATIDSLLQAAKEAEREDNFSLGMEKIVKAEMACQEALDLAQKRNFTDSTRDIEETMKRLSQMKKEFETLEVKSEKLKELERRLNALDLEGFEAEAETLRAQLKDPRKVEQIEEGIKSLGGKIQQRDLWKTKGASLFDTAVELCNEAAGVFYDKQYGRALNLFTEAIGKFIKAKEFAQHDSQLLNSIDENIILAKRNIIACELGLGALKSESAQEQFNAANFEEAIRSFQGALSHFEAAKERATEIGDEAKLNSVAKLINVMNRNVEECYAALDKDKVETLSNTINRLLEEVRRAEVRKDFKEAKEKLSQAVEICHEALTLAQRRDFTEAIEEIKGLMETVVDKVNSLGKEPLPRIEEVKIEIAIDETDETEPALELIDRRQNVTDTPTALRSPTHAKTSILNRVANQTISALDKAGDAIEKLAGRIIKE